MINAKFKKLNILYYGIIHRHITSIFYDIDISKHLILWLLLNNVFY